MIARHARTRGGVFVTVSIEIDYEEYSETR